MRKNLLLATVLIIAFALFPRLHSVWAASFGFDQTTVTVQSGGTFSLKVTVDAGTDELSSVDAYISYDSSLLTADSVADGTFFPTVTNDTTTAGKIYIAGMVDDPATSKTGTGTLATITFKGKADGTATISYDCSSSKIIKNDINATNVLKCTKNGKATITIGAGSTASTPYPTPSSLPQSGVFENVVKFAVPGMMLLLIGAGMRLLL